LIAEKRITLKNVGKINPENIQEYIVTGGYSVIKKALESHPEDIIDVMVNASLRGRGGAGFSAGLKKRFTSKADSNQQRYVICNADEGEPGTFKDRIIMESDPHLLLEGILLASFAICASKAYIYIRAEYYKSIDRVQKAIDAAKKKGFVGKNIFGSKFSCDIEIKLGAGSYLCGEELTLLESLEGKRGYPRIKPPFPAEKGLFACPTLVNNVETLATIPVIIDKGAEWYLKLGMKDSPGTKIFTISGDVKKPGYYELELGVTLRQLIFDLAGGMKNGKKFKAALIGGAAGTFVAEKVFDVPMGYDSLKAVGATLGSGAVIVLDEDKSIDKLMENILKFFKHESCGKCIPCRVGTNKILEIQKTINDKNREAVHKHLLHESEFMARTSLCPLGQSPILPIKSAIKVESEINS